MDGNGDGVVVLQPVVTTSSGTNDTISTTSSSSTMTTSTITSPPQSTTTGAKGHVRELKRLFESKKVVVLDKLSSLKQHHHHPNHHHHTKTHTHSNSTGGSNISNNKSSNHHSFIKTGTATVTTPTHASDDTSIKPTTATIILTTSTINVQQPIVDVSSSSSSNDPNQLQSTIILDKEYKEDDFEISQSDRKYYFYVNEAIRKNQPIIPSLAIRRKSLDLTNSPIKGSLYASKYQHTYSPTTRTLQLSRTSSTKPSSSLSSTPTKSSLSYGESPMSPLYNGSSNNLSVQLHKYQPDSSWIKSKDDNQYSKHKTTADPHQPNPKTGYGTIGGKKSSQSFLNIGNSRGEITFNPTNNSVVSPQKPEYDDIQFRKLSITKSSFELNSKHSGSDFKSVSSPSSPTNSFLSKEEPIPKKSMFSKTPKEEKEKEKEKSKQKSFLHISSSSSTSSSSTSSLEKVIKEKEEKSSSKLFSWVSLRRTKRSNTTEILPVIKDGKVISASSTTSVKKHSPLVPVDHQKQEQDEKESEDEEIKNICNDKDGSTPTILINDNSASLSPTSTPTSTSSSPSTSLSPVNVPSDGASTSKKTSFISHSIMIFKKDLESKSFSQPSSPSSTPSPLVEDLSPKRYMSIASTLQKGKKESASVSSSPTSSTIYSTVSAPSSPSHSVKQLSNLTTTTASSTRQISVSEEHIVTEKNLDLDSPSTASSLQNSTSILQPPLLAIPRVSELIVQTRVGRSSSVGSLIETPRFDVADIPPLKVHVASLEECLEQFNKPWQQSIHGGGRCFVLDLANCSLGNEGLEQINQQCPGGLEIADLSWNDISDQAFEEFGEMLRRTQSLITSLSMQGNQISPTSLQIFLESVGQIEKEKKGYLGFGLNLKETGIENEGAEYLANYIGSNRTPAIVGLNLTCASVTDVGMTHFSGALVRNCHLTTLILDENYLGDDGAILLAEGLKFNKTLTHLQMRNTDIGETGSIELSNTCKFNTTISHIDLSLNPWGLGGEIALQSLLVTKQMLAKTRGVNVPKVVWKDEGMDFWDEDETRTIVQHFGKEKIIDYLVNGLTLSPLISQEKLFEHFNIETTHLASIFKQIVNVSNHINDNHLNSLKLLVQLLPTHLDNHIFLNTFLSNLQPLIALINRTNKRVDYLLLNLLEFFTLLTQSNDTTCYDKFNEFSLYSKCLELFFEFPCNNILHQNILNLVIASTKHSNFNNFEQSIYKIDFLSKLVGFVTLEFQNEPGCRTPNYGHLLEISKLLRDTSTTHPYLSTKEWKLFQATILERESQLQEQFLCGFVPNRNQKIDTALLDKFEKEFKR